VAAGTGHAEGEQPLELAEALDLEAYFLDTTCVKLHIHFPVDWVLLRDAARTLMKATILIRKRNLKVRMEEPEEFLKRMNQLCMKMSHARRKKDAQRARKAVLREMKKLSKIIAAHGVAVAMVDFRNALTPSSAPEVAPFPAGLNDCVSGLKWVHANADTLNIDASRIIVAGESGGGNLTLATGLKLKQDGDLHLIKGLYALCPYIAGEWPLPQNPSSVENNGILLDLHSNRGAMAYGVEAFDARNPLAWPGFATADDVTGLPPTVINVNECDPLRDEGINFYRLLIANGVSARCRQMMGTMHATEVFPVVCPEISRDTARDIAGFCKE